MHNLQFGTLKEIALSLSAVQLTWLLKPTTNTRALARENIERRDAPAILLCRRRLTLFFLSYEN